MSEAVNITTLDIKRSTLTEQAVDSVEDSPRQFANFAEFYPFYLKPKYPINAIPCRNKNIGVITFIAFITFSFL